MESALSKCELLLIRSHEWPCRLELLHFLFLHVCPEQTGLAMGMAMRSDGELEVAAVRPRSRPISKSRDFEADGSSNNS